MSNSLFGKVEALMRKHRGDTMLQSDAPMPSERHPPSPDAWLPVLTDVVKRGSPPPISEVSPEPGNPEPESSSAASAFEEANVASTTEAPPKPVETPEPPPEPVTEPGPVEAPESAIGNLSETKPDEHVAESLVEQLTPRISGLMQDQVAEELRKSLNQSMASLMANLNANVEEIVRQAVAEKLAEKDKKPT